MKIKYLAFPTDRFPCFGFIVCSDNDKLFLPEYSEQDRVNRFIEIELGDEIYVVEYTDERGIIFDDERKYVYMPNNKSQPIIETKEKISPELIKIMKRIEDAPFSKLELAKFLNLKEHELNEILHECYNFLKKINIEYAKRWARENNFIIEPEEEVSPELIKAIERIVNNTFSKFELAFLNITKQELTEIRHECYNFLKEINIEYATRWARKNSNHNVYLNDLGMSAVTRRRARVGRNPATGTAVKIPAKNGVSFVVSKAAKDAILGATQVKKALVKKVASSAKKALVKNATSSVKKTSVKKVTAPVKKKMVAKRK